MSIKKSLLALAVLALTLMGFASSAMAATDGVVRHISGTTPIPENRELHFIGWAEFEKGTDHFRCHVTATVKVTGNTGVTGHVSQFFVPDTSRCTGEGVFAGCKLKEKHESTNLPWHLTVTPTDFDVTGSIVIHNPLEKCNNGTRSATLTFTEVTLKPLKTGVIAATGTATTLGSTAAVGTSSKDGDPIAGVEIHAEGEAHVVDIFGITHHETGVTATGELELTAPDRCTWYLSSN